MENTDHQPVQGRVLNLHASSTRSAIWLGPGWAFLCGTVASASLDVSWDTLISLLLGLLLVDSLLGTLWSLVTSDFTALVASEGRNPGQTATLPALPYTLPGSLSYRSFGFLSERLSLWRSTLASEESSQLLSLIFNPLLALVVAASLGQGPLLLTGMALVIAALRVVFFGAQNAAGLALGSFFLAGLAWMIGYTTFFDFVIIGGDWGAMAQALFWAAIYAVSFHAYRVLSTGDLVKGAGLLGLAQMWAMAILIIVKQPVLAGVVGLLLLPQMLLQPSLLSTGDGLWYLRRAQVFTMAAMMVTASAAVI